MRVVALTSVITLFAIAYTAYSLYRVAYVRVPHSYAAWGTGDLLVEFMETHDGRWPREWKELSEARDSMLRKGRTVHGNFGQLPSMVKIDWDAKPAELAKLAVAQGETAVRVVTRPDGSRLEANWGPDTEPNRKVARYLINRYSASARTNAAESLSPVNSAPSK